MEDNVGENQNGSILRIYLFGIFHVWYRVSPTDVWVELDFSSPPKAVENRGMVLPVTLLKVLCCQPNRHATRDFLLETFWPNKPLTFANSRLDDTLSTLRSFFRCIGFHEKILRTIKGHNGNSYVLDGYPAIWMDIDAFSYYIQQAVRSRRLGDNSVYYWERAHDLAKSGLFLADEVYSQWSKSCREGLMGAYRQCILELGSIYEHVQEKMLLYRKYVDDHPTDEDILCRFLELLGEQECFQEAANYYTRTEQIFRDLHLPLNPHTKELYENVKGKKIIRQKKTTVLSHFSHMIQSEQREVVSSLDCNRNDCLQLFLGSEKNQREPSWFSLKRDLIYILTNQWRGRALYCDDLQSVVSQELSMVNYLQKISSPEDFQVSRRLFLQTLATTLISPQVLELLQETLKPTLVEEFLPNCAATIVTCQHLLRGNGLDIVAKRLPVFLPTLERIARDTSKYQSVAASLTAQAYMLAALVALHYHQISKCDILYQKALQYSAYAQVANLQVGALKQTATRFLEDRKSTLALHFYERALKCIETPSCHVAPHLKGLIYIGVAAAYAQKKERQSSDLFVAKAEMHFFEYRQEEELPYIDTQLHHYYLWKGLIHTEFGENKAAEETFASIDSINVSIAERIRLEILNHRARTAILDNDKERAIKYIMNGAVGAKNLQSEKRFQEVVTIFHEAQIQWPHEHDVSELSEIISKNVSQR